SASIIGGLTRNAAEALQLPPGVPVVAGAGDDVELLGATGHREGIAVEHVGTTGSILVRLERPEVDPSGRVEISPTCVPRIFAAGGGRPNAAPPPGGGCAEDAQCPPVGTARPRTSPTALPPLPPATR